MTPSVIGAPQPLSNDTGSVTLSAASPTFIDGEGNTDSYQEHTFTVPAGADYLNGDITWNALSSGTAAFETLFNPQGQVAAYSLIGTDESGFGHVEVRQPAAGTWTAVIFTVHNAAQYTGAVQFGYSTEQFQQRRRGVPVVADAAARAVGELPGAGARPGRPETRRSACTLARAPARTGAFRSPSGRWCRSPARAGPSPAN